MLSLDLALTFAPVEKAIAEEFLTALLGNSFGTTTNLCNSLGFLARFSGLGVSDLTTQAQGQFDMSAAATKNFVVSLQNTKELDSQKYCNKGIQ